MVNKSAVIVGSSMRFTPPLVLSWSSVLLTRYNFGSVAWYAIVFVLIFFPDMLLYVLL